MVNEQKKAIFSTLLKSCSESIKEIEKKERDCYLKEVGKLVIWVHDPSSKSLMVPANIGNKSSSSYLRVPLVWSAISTA